MEKKFIEVYVKVKCGINRFFHDEKGASDILAMIIIIGVVLAIAFIFRKNLINLVKSLWNSVVKGEPTGTETINGDLEWK